jgi:hypothetical protein
VWLATCLTLLVAFIAHAVCAGQLGVAEAAAAQATATVDEARATTRAAASRVDAARRRLQS